MKTQCEAAFVGNLMFHCLIKELAEQGTVVSINLCLAEQVKGEL